MGCNLRNLEWTRKWRAFSIKKYIMEQSFVSPFCCRKSHSFMAYRRSDLSRPLAITVGYKQLWRTVETNFPHFVQWVNTHSFHFNGNCHRVTSSCEPQVVISEQLSVSDKSFPKPFCCGLTNSYSESWKEWQNACHSILYSFAPNFRELSTWRNMLLPLKSCVLEKKNRFLSQMKTCHISYYCSHN